MTGASAGRDGHEVEALVTDRYLEALLAAHARGADRGPTAQDPDEAVRRTADRLARDLPRFHPSFLFEEALAARLANHRVAIASPRRGWSGGTGRARCRWATRLDRPSAMMRRRPVPAGRPLIIGGALTSAALSLAGAAYVAWRLNRPATGPMVRAARAVARSRLA